MMNPRSLYQKSTTALAQKDFLANKLTIMLRRATLKADPSSSRCSQSPPSDHSGAGGGDLGSCTKGHGGRKALEASVNPFGQTGQGVVEARLAEMQLSHGTLLVLECCKLVGWRHCGEVHMLSWGGGDHEL